MRMGTCICVGESLCCLPETITTLLLSYAPIQNKKFNKLKKKPKVNKLWYSLNINFMYTEK